MAVYDVFNGDADGICALTQLRNAEPLESELVTGVKRDIKLLDNLLDKLLNNLSGKIALGGDDQVNVLDVSMDKNKPALLRILDSGAQVFYCDHHVAGDIPNASSLDALINTSPDICTSLLINGRLQGAYARWALVGAFGDNLHRSASALAGSLNLSDIELKQLENLGIYINYNGYGASLDDLHFKPAELYTRVSQYDDPLRFLNDDRQTFQSLEHGYEEDMLRAAKAEQLRDTTHSAAFLLPDEKWARRVSGVYGNDLANQSPHRAHAVLTERPDGTYLVSVRAPLNNKTAADELCMEFPTGGGRKAAAGINALPANLLGQFLDRLDEIYT